MSGLWLPVKSGQDIFHGGVGDLGAGDKVPHGWSGVETLLAVVNKRINYIVKLQSFSEFGRRGLQNSMLFIGRLPRMLIILASLGEEKNKKKKRQEATLGVAITTTSMKGGAHEE